MVDETRNGSGRHVVAPSARVRNAPITVDRLRTRRGDPATGEVPLPVEEHEASDVRSGLFFGQGMVAEDEVAPVVQRRLARPRPAGERVLRLAAGLALALAALVLFGDAGRQAVVRLRSGARDVVWRMAPLTVRSNPSGARVFVQDALRGATPFSSQEPCRGRPIRVRVEAASHGIWEWRGLCPYEGPVALEANLQQLR
ncbi:MAG: hypothetical protein IT371_14965 [Deltaproteobacteria bacterium]|nr:hypothetical protein [Deltaproteobacteria bacterium]